MKSALQQMADVATKHGLDVHAMNQGVTIIRFPDVLDRTPLLITADDGETWCPETSIRKEKAWSGPVSLKGTELAKEIRSMYTLLDMGSPDAMLEVVVELENISRGKVFH